MLPKPFLLVCFCSTKDLRCLLVDKVWFLSLWIAGSQERPQAEGPETTGDLGLSLPSSVLPSCRLTGWEVLGWWRDPWRHCWLVTNLWFIFLYCSELLVADFKAPLWPRQLVLIYFLIVLCWRIPIYMELKFDVGVNIAIGLIQFPPMSALFDKRPGRGLNFPNSFDAAFWCFLENESGMCVMWHAKEMWDVHRWHVWTLCQQVGAVDLSWHLRATGPASSGG